MADAKTLKQCGVPYGARIVFRLQYAPFVGMCLLMVCTLPFVFLWGLIHESAVDFLEGVTELLSDRLDDLNAHRARVIRLYDPEVERSQAPSNPVERVSGQPMRDVWLASAAPQSEMDAMDLNARMYPVPVPPTDGVAVSERPPAQPGMQQCCDGHVRLGEKCGRCGSIADGVPASQAPSDAAMLDWLEQHGTFDFYRVLPEAASKDGHRWRWRNEKEPGVRSSADTQPMSSLRAALAAAIGTAGVLGTPPPDSRGAEIPRSE